MSSYNSEWAPTCFFGADFAGGCTGFPSSKDVAGYDPEFIIHPGNEVHHLGCLFIAFDSRRIYNPIT